MSAKSFFFRVLAVLVGLTAFVPLIAGVAGLLAINDPRNYERLPFPKLLLLGFLIGVLLLWCACYLADEPHREACARQKTQEEEARQAELMRQAATQAAQKAKLMADAAKVRASAQASAAKLPLYLAEAELALDRAEHELAEKLPSPFWEAVEDVALRLSEFDREISGLNARRQEHRQLIHSLGGTAGKSNLEIMVLPDPGFTNKRVNEIFRRGQRVDGFPMIYEQRRTSSVLIKGFRSLGNAIVSLGDRLESELASLGSTLDCRLSDLESALKESADQLANQHRELLRSAESARSDAQNAHAEIATIARERIAQAEKDSRERRDYERATRAMLAKIQHRAQRHSIVVDG